MNNPTLAIEHATRNIRVVCDYRLLDDLGHAIAFEPEGRIAAAYDALVASARIVPDVPIPTTDIRYLLRASGAMTAKGRGDEPLAVALRRSALDLMDVAYDDLEPRGKRAIAEIAERVFAGTPSDEWIIGSVWASTVGRMPDREAA